MELWPHQQRGISETIALIESGAQRICYSACTGSGKTRVAIELIRWALERAWRVVVYTNRKVLIEQLSRVFSKAGLSHSVRAADWETNLLDEVQISSVQTENSRVYRSGKWPLHVAKLVIVDEAHINRGRIVARMLDDHVQQNAHVIGLTGTALELSHLYQHQVNGGQPSECRACGALVPAYVYAPDEVDTARVGRTKTGEFVYKDLKHIVRTQVLVGSVYKHWHIYNPYAQPAVLFGAGVAEAMFHCRDFWKRGVPAAHVDGKHVLLDGNQYESTRELRDEIAERLREGELKVVCNRFVLREGWDMPELYHGILACPIGSLQSYLQSAGRLLRAHESLDHVIITDHGGNWHRHGSPNADRNWDIAQTGYKITALREQRMRERKEPEPIACPECHTVRRSGCQCPKCGFEHIKKSRMVIMTNGRLKEVVGDIYKPRRTRLTHDTQNKWDRMYWRMKRADKTFRQAEGLFVRENWYWPPRTLRLMPIEEADFFRKIRDVPMQRLIGYEERKVERHENQVQMFR